MNPVALANATTFALTSLLAAIVLARRPARSVEGLLFLLLLGIGIWSGGAVWRADASSLERLMAAHHIVFLGIATVPPTWLLLGLAVTRVQVFESRPARVMWLVVPSLLAYLAFVTNPAHGLFATITLDDFARGPLFWAMMAWCFACSVTGSVFFLGHARRMAHHGERTSARLLMASGVIPQAVAAVYLFELLPLSFDPTPGALGVSAALLYPLIVRMRTFEDLPLLRRDVIEHLPDAVIIADPAGQLVDLNPEARALLLEEPRLRETRLDEVLAAIAPEPGLALVDDILAGGDTGRGELRAEDGRRFRMQAARVRSEGGDAAGYFVVLHDRSDEVRAERALRQAQRLDSVGMLAAGVAHELNNPLAFVTANLNHVTEAVDIAKRNGSADPREAALLDEAPSVLAETRQGIERIAGIVSGMQRLSRNVEAGHERLDLHEVVDEAVRMASLARDRCTVEIDLAPALPAVQGSRGELLQVLLNLLVNAKQAVSQQPGGRLRVSTRARGDRVEVAVEDDGPGVPDEWIERIFDPFFTTKGPDQGSGLGLSIAYDLVRDHGGTLEADASPLGGARFVVRLPALR